MAFTSHFESSFGEDSEYTDSCSLQSSTLPDPELLQTTVLLLQELMARSPRTTASKRPSRFESDASEVQAVRRKTSPSASQPSNGRHKVGRQPKSASEAAPPRIQSLSSSKPSPAPHTQTADSFDAEMSQSNSMNPSRSNPSTYAPSSPPTSSMRSSTLIRKSNLKRHNPSNDNLITVHSLLNVVNDRSTRMTMKVIVR